MALFFSRSFHGMRGAAQPLHRVATPRAAGSALGPWRSGGVSLLACVLLGGCSLLTIKSPEIPLTPREQEARLLTRDYAAHFAGSITHLLDETPRGGNDPAMQTTALRLKLGAVTEITRTSTGLSPTASLLDTWAFAVQLRDFLTVGAGLDLLGGAQPEVRLGVTQLAVEADALALKVLGNEYPRYRTFVMDFAEHNPLLNSDCSRVSVLSAWLPGEKDQRPLRAVGTVAQALGDVSDRMRIYGERAPAMGLWQAELALDRAGFDEATYRHALGNVETQLERLSTLADTSPELAHRAIAELRGSLRASSDRLDASWMQMLRTLRVEREALAANIASERESVTAAFDVERVQMSKDAAQIAARAVETSWQQLRQLVREALLLVIVLVLVLLGLPFVAGYLVGRRRRVPEKTSP